MKKSVVVLFAFSLIGLASLAAQPAAQSPYYPLNVGDRWTYRVIDLKSTAAKLDLKKKVVVEVERQEAYTRKDDKDQPDVRKGYLLKSMSGGKTTYDHVVKLEDGVYRVHAAGAPISPPLLFLKHSDKEFSQKWDCNSVSGNVTIKGTFTLKTDKVKVPLGEYKTIVASFTNHEAGEKLVEIDYWFAEGTGMVKQRVREKNREIALELEKFEPAKKK